MFSSNTSQVSSAANYVEDVFSTYLYTGNSSTQTITNGIDLSGKGGMVWVKSRDQAFSHYLGSPQVTRELSSNSTGIGESSGTMFNAYNSNGFTLQSSNGVNGNTYKYASWTFRKQAKFFDIVTYTGNGANRTIAHNLGSVPGCIIVKRTDTTADWQVYHRSLANTEYMVLNSTVASATGTTRWNSTTPTSTVFSVGTDATVNANGGTYVAYLFANDAGGFGLAGTDNVISCGTYTGNLSADVNVTLGYEPQWILLKQNSAGQNWYIWDTMRGWSVASPTLWLNPNTNGAETNPGSVTGYPTATGFTIPSGQSNAADYIYIAIRRGPMKTPTSGTSVFDVGSANETSGVSPPQFNSGFPVDMAIKRIDATSQPNYLFDRLRGGYSLATDSTAAESAFGAAKFDYMIGWYNGTGTSSTDYSWMWRRAPGFFDVVCYTGTAGNLTINHNLGVVPQLIIFKRRNTSGAWWVWHTSFTTYPDYHLILNTTAAQATGQYLTDVTSTSFSLANAITADVNASGGTYVAYLFASCPGVSKVGSYSGTGSTQTISCGFAARFVIIKRTDSTGNWLVFDTYRGMVAGTDPSILLNSTAASSNTNRVYTDASGFQLVTSDGNLNASGGTYIYLAIV